MNQIDVLFAKKEYKPLLQARLRENAEREEKASSNDSGNAAEPGEEKKGEVEYREAAEGNA